MAEAQNPDDLTEDDGVIDPDLLGEDELEDEPQPPLKPAKKKGRKKKKSDNKEDTPPSRRRAFVESSVKTTMARNDPMEVMNRYDWDSGDYDVSISRVQPQTWHGRNILGYIASYPHSIDESFIREHHGGGVFDLKIRGPNARTGTTKSFLDGVRIKVSGEPIISPMDKHLVYDDGGIVLASAQNGPPSMRQIREARSSQKSVAERQKEEWGESDMGDESIVKMSLEQLREDKVQARKEAAALRERLFDSRRNNGDSSMSEKAIKIIQEQSEKAIEAERKAAERIEREHKQSQDRFEQMMARFGERNAGVPPEMLASLTEQHRSELSQVQESRLQQIQELQNRHDHEITTLRDRYERELGLVAEKSKDEVVAVRNELQGRLDREQEQARRDIERADRDAQARVDKINEEWQRRFDQMSEDWKRRYDQEKQSGIDATSRAVERADADRRSAEAQAKLQMEHMKNLHESQLSQERSQFEARIAQMQAQSEAQVQMQATSFNSQITSLNNELERTRADLAEARSKVADQGDLATQAKRIKEVNESLGAVFSLGGAGGEAAGGLVAAGAEIDVEPKQEEPKTWWGKLMQFAESPMGEGAFQILQTMAGGAMMGMPGPYQQAPQPSYGPPQASYGPPQQAPYSPYATGPVAPQAPPPPAHGYTPQPEYEGDGTMAGRFVDDDEVEEAGPAPETEQLRSQVGPDGVIRADVPPVQNSQGFGGIQHDAKGPVVEPESQPEEQPQQTQPARMPPEVAEQLKAMVSGLEESMRNQVPPETLAQTITKMAPPEQVRPFAHTPIQQLVTDIQQIMPESLLITYQGRQYLQALQASLSQLLG